MFSEADPYHTALEFLQHAPCGLLRTAANGTILNVNDTFCGWVGQNAEALVRQRRLQDFLTVGGRIFHQTHWAPLLQIQGSISEVKLELLHADGKRIPVVLNAVLRTRDGLVLHDVAVFVAHDRDKYERELLSSRKRLEALVADATRLEGEAKDRALLAEQMIGIVSHDLRNPLSSIRMGASLLASGKLAAQQQRVLDRITRATERAAALIADLLDFTQVRLGRRLSVTMQTIDLHRIVAEAVEELALAHPNRLLQHQASGEGSSEGDANRLAQLVGNLVSNAMAYGAADGPVLVSTAVMPAAFSIAVRNDGAPISPEVQAHLFEPMSRGAHATNAARSVGLGLFIVSEIAKAHGGTIAVSSSVENGTCFTATFPRQLPGTRER